MFTFPEGFLWGAATSSHQVEGDNFFNDWWKWEQSGGGLDRSSAACRHFSLYKEDFALARSLGHNAHRFSIEWSRVEPEEGHFSQSALDHYSSVLDALAANDLEPVVTLYHFTSPAWFSRKGGWLKRANTACFCRYIEKMTGVLSGKARYLVTVNEPLVYAYHSYLTGVWPPQQRSFIKAARVSRNLLSAHELAYRIIHDRCGVYKNTAPSVSVAHHMQYFMPWRPGIWNQLGVFLRDMMFNRMFLDAAFHAGTLDYIGLNYYTRQLVSVEIPGLRSLLSGTRSDNAWDKSSLGWDIYPHGLSEILLSLRKYALPVLILENGIATVDDRERAGFIKSHLEAAAGAIKAGVDLKGYFYWSLLDNFEWDKGFAPRFGLVEVDYATQERRARESASWFSRVCRTGELPE